MIAKYLQFFQHLFLDLKFDAYTSLQIAEGIGIVTLIIVSFLLFFLVKWILKRFVGGLIRKTKTKYDDFFLGRKLEKRLAFLVPIYMIKGLVYTVAPDLDSLNAFIIVCMRIAEVTTFTGILLSILDSLSDIYNSFDVAKNKPMKGLLQIAKIVAIMVCVLLVVGVIQLLQHYWLGHRLGLL